MIAADLLLIGRGKRRVRKREALKREKGQKKGRERREESIGEGKRKTGPALPVFFRS